MQQQANVLTTLLRMVAKRVLGEQLSQIVLMHMFTPQQHLPIAASASNTTSSNTSAQQQLIPASQHSFPQQQLILHNNPYSCKKCQHAKYHTGEIREVSGLISKIFNLQTRRFKTVSCDQCGYTEYYERAQSALANVTDLIVR